MRRGEREVQQARAGTAMLLCAVSVAGLTLLRLGSEALGLSGAAALAVQTGGTLLCVLLPAALGLLALDGDQTALVRLRTLTPAHIRLVALTGALAICPATLLSDVVTALTAALTGNRAALSALAEAASAAPDGRLFLPMLLQSALLAPVCEELFFRGYLLGVFGRGGGRRLWAAALATALLFALAHGLDLALPTVALLGALFALLALRAESVLAAMLAHGCYNAALLAAAFAGLGGLFGGLTPVSCVLRLLGTAAFAAALRRTASLRPSRKRARIRDGGAFTRREKALLLGAALALIASQAALMLLDA